MNTPPTLIAFDPPMCCSSGVCGPEVDPQLVRFADDLRWLGRQGVEVVRYNLAQQPGAFARNPVVLRDLREHGEACLPLVMLDDTVMCRGSYPDRATLAGWLGLDDGDSASGKPVAAERPA